MTALQALRNRVAEFIRPKELTERQGTSGTQIYGGYLTDEDHNTEWHQHKAIENVDKMLFTDALISASLSSFTLPILAGEFSIKPASEQPIDFKVAEFVEVNLFRNENFNWLELLRQQLLYLAYGFAAFSKQYAVRDGKTWLDRIIYLYPDTIERYFPDEDGDLSYIEQFAYDWRLGRYDTFRIDIDHLFLLTHLKQGNNYRGTSMLRPCWGSFKMKQLTVKLHAGALERWTIGTPKGTIKGGKGNVDDLRTALESIRSHEKGYIIETPEYAIDVLQNRVDSDPAMQAIAHHNKEINTAFQREFMSLGHRGEGSLALGKTQQGIFYDAINAVGKYLEDMWNQGEEKQQHIKQLVRENFANVTEFPQLQITPKSVNLIIELASALPGLATAGLLRIGDDSLVAIHNALGLPAPEEMDANIKPISQDMPPEIGNGKQGKAEELTPALQLEKKSRNERLSPSVIAREQRILNLQRIETILDTAHAQLQEDVKLFSARIEQELIEQGTRIFTKAQSLQELVEMIDKVPMPLQGSLANAITQNARRLFDFGRGQVQGEVSRQRKDMQKVSPPLAQDADAAKKSLRTTVKTKVENFLVKIFAEWKAALVAMFKAGDFSTADLRESIQRVSRRKIVQELGGSLNEAFGLGRNVEILRVLQRNPDAKMWRSEVLDENTCDPCVVIDGAEFTRNDELFRLVVNGPYARCEGKSRCRGINFIEI